MVDPLENYPDLPSAIRPGARVMIRRRLSTAEIEEAAGTLDASKTLTDAVGTVTVIDDEAITIETRRGSERVRRADVVTAKALGPRPTRRGAPHRAVSVSDLEELMVDGWRPHEQKWLGRWMLRAAGGYTGRANSCLVLGEAGLPTADALSAVGEWYAERDLPPLLQVPLAPGFDAHEDLFVREATSLGWEAFGPVRVMTAASAVVAQAGRASSASSHPPRIDVRGSLTDAWWALVDDRARAHESAARGVLTASADQRFLAISQSDETLAHARLALSPGWGGIFSLATRPDARRRGLARCLVAACAHEATGAGVPSLYLQVAADNSTAVALYESMGFTTHHTYVYLRPAA